MNRNSFTLLKLIFGLRSSRDTRREVRRTVSTSLPIRAVVLYSIDRLLCARTFALFLLFRRSVVLAPVFLLWSPATASNAMNRCQSSRTRCSTVAARLLPGVPTDSPPTRWPAQPRHRGLVGIHRKPGKLLQDPAVHQERAPVRRL